MVYKSFVSLDKYYFSDSVGEVIKKTQGHPYYRGVREFMGVTNPSLQVDSQGLYFVFHEDGNSIGYIEISKRRVEHEGYSILGVEYSTVFAHFKNKDEDLIEDEDGFTSPKFGLGVHRSLSNGVYSSTSKSVIVFDAHYMGKSMPSSDDIIRYYMGDAD